MTPNGNQREDPPGPSSFKEQVLMYNENGCGALLDWSSNLVTRPIEEGNFISFRQQSAQVNLKGSWDRVVCVGRDFISG